MLMPPIRVYSLIIVYSFAARSIDICINAVYIVQMAVRQNSSQVFNIKHSTLYALERKKKILFYIFSVMQDLCKIYVIAM